MKPLLIWHEQPTSINPGLSGHLLAWYPEGGRLIEVQLSPHSSLLHSRFQCHHATLHCVTVIKSFVLNHKGKVDTEIFLNRLILGRVVLKETIFVSDMTQRNSKKST